ncbi:GyrI-like domain-containing protein [Vibrio sp. 10N.222.51.C12]|uniref:GyrI-like domain-containing protein n=1 Tax=unclassified Vibrio TaxID=2614977 RepID=UPI000C8649D1|nr:GyrI-like domain-containing protein [Vibrio sp. 10N.286.48.B7]PMH78813.1 hypothetical protein BCU58_07620 [Vibrio sp. 10N.286.48.B7]
MSEKHEWRKKEKSLYLPKNKPEIVTVPEFKFLTVKGQGNPNSDEFSACVAALYSVAYAIKMQLKNKEAKPKGYIDFTVYPLEGIWDITDQAKQDFTGTINKDDLVYQLMIRQPSFIDAHYFQEMLVVAKQKKPNPMLDRVEFKTCSEGLCVQMLHLGPFENESFSFDEMEKFAKDQSLTRMSKVHREIYLSDARKVSPEKYKTVLRFQAH